MLQVETMVEKLRVERLVWARSQMDISQRELARRLGIPSAHYNGIELGHHQPSLALIIKLARVLDISIDYLVGMNDAPEITAPKALSPEQETLLRLERMEKEIKGAKRAIKSIEGKRERS